MAYQKQTWRGFDDTKTELQNINNGAVVTPERLNHIENGIANSADKAEVTAQLQQTKDEVLEMVGNVADGTPLFADSVPNMTDITRIYLNTTDGYLYAHDGTSFKSTGIVYLSNSIEEYMTEENESWVI